MNDLKQIKSNIFEGLRYIAHYFRGSRHTLILRSLREEDFANYSCYAANTLGKARAYLTLRGGLT